MKGRDVTESNDAPQEQQPGQDTRTDINELVKHAAGAGLQFLGSNRGLYPFALALTTDGQFVQVQVELSEGEPFEPEQFVERLVAEAAKGADKGLYRACAVVAPVRVNLPDQDQPTDALRIQVEHMACQPLDVFVPYTIGEQDVTPGEPITQAGQSQVFAGPDEAADADQAEANLQRGQEFLASNAERDEVTVTDSGLQYEVLSAGEGPSPGPSDEVTVHYRGTNLDGEEFDSSYSRGEPTSFPVDGVIPGWTEALQQMKEGGKWKLYIPPELAYGQSGAGGVIGPNQTLVFEVELLKVG